MVKDLPKRHRKFGSVIEGIVLEGRPSPFALLQGTRGRFIELKLNKVPKSTKKNSGTETVGVVLVGVESLPSFEGENLQASGTLLRLTVIRTTDLRGVQFGDDRKTRRGFVFVYDTVAKKNYATDFVPFVESYRLPKAKAAKAA